MTEGKREGPISASITEILVVAEYTMSFDDLKTKVEELIGSLITDNDFKSALGRLKSRDAVAYNSDFSEIYWRKVG